ncbi:uncharacterized protein CEXT_303811 [Caerostris extrusa]|uniref:Uncharacterized protein n=1 Tax=Caerostris extrusa TaxID=172846 RepID=A0AAV4MQJ7_CAEEX|nr:uncharacterized protein CEXT_303811 [Caerostris extrusa]
MSGIIMHCIPAAMILKSHHGSRTHHVLQKSLDIEIDGNDGKTNEKNTVENFPNIEFIRNNKENNTDILLVVTELRKLYNRELIGISMMSKMKIFLKKKSIEAKTPSNSFWNHIKTMGFREDEGSYVIASLSLGDLLGRLCLGWVTDKGFMDVPRFFLVGMILQGVNTASIPPHANKAAVYISLYFRFATGFSIRATSSSWCRRYILSNFQSLAVGCLNFFPESWDWHCQFT